MSNPSSPPVVTSANRGATEQGGIVELVNDTMPAYWAERINRMVEKTARSMVETGQELCGARGKLKYGLWLKMFKTGQVKLDLSLAQRLMKVVANPAMTKTANLPYLPPSPTALVALSNLPPEIVEAGIADKQINPSMTIAAAAKFVKEHQVEPEGVTDTGPEQVTQPDGTATRSESIVVLWDDSEAPPTRSPEKSYGAKTYPNLAFLRFHEAGDINMESVSKHGLAHVALFAVPVEPTKLIKDKQGRPFCKASFRFLALSMRGTVQEPTTVPSQLIDGGFTGVTKMIDSMFPDALKVLSSAEHEAPQSWQYVPRDKKAVDDPSQPSERAAAPKTERIVLSAEVPASMSKREQAVAHETTAVSIHPEKTHERDPDSPTFVNRSDDAQHSERESISWDKLNWRLTNVDLAEVWKLKYNTVKQMRCRQQRGTADKRNPEAYQQAITLEETKALAFSQSRKARQA